MPGFDDRLTRELERAARPAAPDPVRTFDDVTRRRAHRTVVRKIQVVSVVVAILAVTGGAFLFLDGRFDDDGVPLAPVDAGGTMTFTWVDRGSVIAGVWATAGDGSNARELFPPSFPDGTLVESVVVSPDGGRIAYVANQDYGAQPGIVVAHADGTEPGIVSANLYSSQLAWSPDGATIAALVPGPRRHVVLITAAGSDPQRLSATAGATSFDWAPDGRSLYVATVEGDRSTIRAVPLADDGDRRVFQVGGTVRALAVSPSDGTIAYVADVILPTFGSPGDVWLLDPSTGKTTRLTTDGVATDVAWSPDGTRLAMSLDLCSVSTMAPDGSDADTLTFRDAAGGCPADVAWGPGLPESFTATALPTVAEPVPASFLQERPVLGIVPAGDPDAPRVTCEPGACTPGDLSADTVALFDTSGNVLSLGPVVIDASNVSVAKLAVVGRTPTEWVVTFELDEAGTAAFTTATEEAFRSPPPRNQIAIVVDGTVVSAPVVQEPITSGTGQLSGGWSETEARALADSLNAGVVEDQDPSPDRVGRDVGLDLRMCRVKDLAGLDLGDGPIATAFVGGRVIDGRCSDEYEGPNILAVDLSSDGSADTWVELPWCVMCAPLGTMDQKLFVTLQLASTTEYGIYGLDETMDIVPLTMDPPGDTDWDFPAREPVTFWAGGDAGFSSWVSCTGDPQHPTVIVTQSSVPVDTPIGTPYVRHTTEFTWDVDGAFVLATSDEDLVLGDEVPAPLTGGCALEFVGR